MENGDVIHIVLAFYDSKGLYARYAGVVMVSIFENTKSMVCVHILHDETLTGQNRALLSETAEIYCQKAEFHDVSPLMDRVGDDALKLTKQWSVGTLFRLFIPDLLPVGRIIYLDCDILVTLDIKELWDVPLGGRSLAGAVDCAVNDKLLSPQALRCRLLGCEWRSYINAGVLVMDLARIRGKHDLLHESAAWFERHGHNVISVDQDFINSCFYKDIKIIDEKYNSAQFSGDLSGRVLHALINPKPWAGMVGTDLERIFWKTYLKTPWGRSAPDVIDLMLDAVKTSPYMHRRTSRCYARILSRFRNDIFRSTFPRIIRLFMNDLYHRIKRGFARRG
ncbi:MAG: glycosyltransferase family 8 protein [Synergistaceae bacterium]|jgi:lipopolysaccharide biosynthesis glycosyltransferase|nr:glycosyltransferase family 8 protein [Synergistaceae bacterium]